MKKNIKPLLIGVISFILLSIFFADWENFKAGLFGKPPIVKISNMNPE
jgi:hypothetical protein|tara:strand:+ start:125 stop:268 length:144 start_codon:yes stop_codon:yes gene_type:complete